MKKIAAVTLCVLIILLLGVVSGVWHIDFINIGLTLVNGTVQILIVFFLPALLGAILGLIVSLRKGKGSMSLIVLLCTIATGIGHMLLVPLIVKSAWGRPIYDMFFEFLSNNLEREAILTYSEPPIEWAIWGATAFITGYKAVRTLFSEPGVDWTTLWFS